MKLAIFGNGKMGTLLAALAKEAGHEIVLQTSKNHPYRIEDLKNADVCVDFSNARAVISHLKLALTFKKPLVIGTTGWESDMLEAKQLVEAEKGSVIFSPNFSVGIALFSMVLARAADLFHSFPQYSIQGIEMHHQEKKDTPSGTAKYLSSLFHSPLSFTSIRAGHFPGTHIISFDSKEDTITLTHEARNREGFAKGALFAAQWILNKQGWWTFDELIRSLYSSYHTFSE